MSDAPVSCAFQGNDFNFIKSNRETWEEILGIMQKQDDKFVGQWRDELQNWLTFVSSFRINVDSLVEVAHGWRIVWSFLCGRLGLCGGVL